MSCGIVILSRYNSTRLPGKALKKIGSKEILKHITEVVKLTSLPFIVATSEEQSDDVIVNWCNTNGIEFYRGSLNNVASRFYEAAKCLGTDYAIRLNGDNFFISLELIDQFKQYSKLDYDFVSNVEGRTYPYGMSLEMVKLSYYKSILDEIAKSNEYKEHVTSYIYINLPHKYVKITNNKYPKLEGVQLALDTKDDYDHINKLYHYLHKRNLYPLTDLAQFEQIIHDKDYLER